MFTRVLIQRLTKNHVYTSLFDGKGTDPVAHVNLGRTADAVLIAPATANIIAKIKNGQYIALDKVESICTALDCTPNDILKFISDK